MPYDPYQLKVDVDSITSNDKWKDEAQRRNFIRQVGIDAKSALDPVAHKELMDSLWQKAEPGAAEKAGKFVGRAVEEVVKSVPAAGGAAVMALSDLAGVTDSGSGTRLEQGVKGLVDTAGQRIKQFDPNDRQEQRDALLESLKTDLDRGAVPAGFERWLSGEFDNKGIDDPDTKQFVDAVVSSISRAGVAADRMGDIDAERLNAFMQSDRNPARADSDIPDQAGARQFLADYVATKDPQSWEAFKERVTETDQQYEGRMRRWVAQKPEAEAVLKAQEGTLIGDLTQRALSMQESPIDLGTAVLPFLRGAKALQAARAGGTTASVAKDIALGMGKEAAQEAGTEYLQDPRATAGQIAEAGALGAIGSGVVEGGMAGVGALTKPGDLAVPTTPEEVIAEEEVRAEEAPLPEPLATTEAATAVEKALSSVAAAEKASEASTIKTVEAPLTEAAAVVAADNADVLPMTAAALADELPEEVKVEDVVEPETVPPESQTSALNALETQIQETGGPAPLEGQSPQTSPEVQAQEGVAQREGESQEGQIVLPVAEETAPPVSAPTVPTETPVLVGQTQDGGGLSEMQPPAEGSIPAVTEGSVTAETEKSSAENVPPATPGALPQTVSIANEPMNIVAETLGLPRLETPKDGPYPHSQAFEDARRIVAEDPQRGSLLVKQINTKPRALTPVEVPILLHEAVTRRRSLDAAATALADATEANREMAQQRYSDAVVAYAELQNASAVAGTETGRALNFRKMTALLDYSLANMVTVLEGSLQRRLTPEEVQEVKKAQEAITSAEKEVDDLEASQGAAAEIQSIFDAVFEEAMAETRVEGKKLITDSRKAAKEGKSLKEFLKEKSAEARRRIRQRGGNLNVGINPADLFDRAVIMASYIVDGVTSLADLTAKMVKEFGEAIRKHIPQIKKEADVLLENEQEIFNTVEGQEVAKSAIEKLRESDGEALTPRWVYEAVKEQVKAGKKTLDEVFKAITAEVQSVSPEVTERQLRDLFSGYGKIKFPSQEELPKKVRELRRLAQLQSAIEDAQKRIAPMRSGPQRDEASLAVREAQKELHRVMREMGVERAPGPRALKTALDAAKTRLKNQIEELNKQIQEGKRTERPRKELAYDEEAKALESQRDALQKTLDEIDAPKPPTAQERIQATLKDLDKQIAELERRVREKDFAPTQNKMPITAQIQVKRDQRDALAETLREIRREVEGDPVLSQDEINEMAERNLSRQIDELERQIKEKDVAPEQGPKAEATPAITRLKMKRDALREQRDELKKQMGFGKKGKTEAERIDIAVKALEKSIDKLNQQIIDGDVGTKGRASKTPEVAKVKNLRAERDSLRQEVQRLRKAKEDAMRDPVAEQIEADRKHLDRQIKNYEERIKKGDFRPRPKKAKEYDESLVKKQVQLTNLKEEWSKRVFEASLASRTPFKKVWDAGAQTLNTSRAILTSFDLSGVLRQGGFITLGNPMRALVNIGPMLRAFASEDTAKASLVRLKTRENWGNYVRSGLYIAETDTTKLSAQEEAYMSRWIDKIPEGAKGLFIGSFVRGSQRAYTTFLNNLRADTFDSMLNCLQKGPKPTPQEMESIAGYINVATGRGDLGKGKINQMAVGLNTIFFAPRLVASRFQIIGGYPVFKATGRTKALVLKEYAKFLTGATIVYALGSLAQDDDDKPLELDPRSSDFLKMRFGDTRVEVLGGLIQSTVFVSRIVSGEKKNMAGKIIPIRDTLRLPNLFREVPRKDKVPYGGDNVFDVAANFARSKFSPAFGGFVDVTVGKNVIGEPVTPMDVGIKMVVPMSFSETKETMEAHGVPKGATLTTLMLFGAGVQTYNDRKK